jgi:hypothetical protein
LRHTRHVPRLSTRCFGRDNTLQVDDLEEIGDLEGYIDRSSTILIYCSSGYFQSKNCMRELVATTHLQKPTIALIDPDASRGGLSVEEVLERLLEAGTSYTKWGFDPGTTPDGQALHDHLFQDEPVEWNRECSHTRRLTAVALTDALCCPL